MLNSHQLRRHGWVLLLCGLFLFGLIVGLPLIGQLTMGPTLEFSSSVTRGDKIVLFAVLGLIALLGLLIAIAGGFQVMTGRRLRHAHVAMIGLVVAIVLAFWFAGALDGVSPRPFPRRMSVP